MDKEIRIPEKENTMAIHITNNIEIWQSGDASNIKINQIDLEQIIANATLANVSNNEYGWKELMFWGTIDIIITQSVSEEQCLGGLTP